MIATRLFVPLSEYEGSDGPAGKLTPEGWLGETVDGKAIILTDDPMWPANSITIPIAIGDEVDFAWWVPRGKAIIRGLVGAVEVEGNIPADVNQFVVDLGDDAAISNPQGDTLDEVKRQFSEIGLRAEFPLWLTAAGVSRFRLDVVNERLTFMEATA